MSYVGYIPIVKQFIHSLPPEHIPTLLEVGVDRGVSFFSLAVFLARTRKAFVACGVDVMVQEQVQLVLQNLDLAPEQRAFCVQGNSLEVLPKMVEQGIKFDVVMIDGDHNYHTVSQELGHLEDIVHPHSLVVIDDYDGRWAERDLWYAERGDYQDNQLVTRPVETEKHGVRAAVDEWLAAHPVWQKAQPVPGEAIVLLRTSA